MSHSIRPFPVLARALVAALAVVLVASAAPAQQAPAAPGALTASFPPSHLDMAGQVLRASGLTQVFQNSAPDIVGSIRVNVTRQRPELAGAIEEVLKLVEAETGKLANEGVNAAARFLAARLTEPELKEINTFLTSPVGKKYVETLPAFMEEVTPFLQVWNQEVQGRLIQLFQSEMNKRGHKL